MSNFEEAKKHYNHETRNITKPFDVLKQFHCFDCNEDFTNGFENKSGNRIGHDNRED